MAQTVRRCHGRSVTWRLRVLGVLGVGRVLGVLRPAVMRALGPALVGALRPCHMRSPHTLLGSIATHPRGVLPAIGPHGLPYLQAHSARAIPRSLFDRVELQP
jgi:hypothetical protein